MILSLDNGHHVLNTVLAGLGEGLEYKAPPKKEYGEIFMAKAMRETRWLARQYITQKREADGDKFLGGKPELDENWKTSNE